MYVEELKLKVKSLFLGVVMQKIEILSGLSYKTMCIRLPRLKVTALSAKTDTFTEQHCGRC